MASILNLSKRLETVVELCDENKIIADIGCDHGLVTAELVLQNKAQKVIATEISRDCLNKAVSLADSINITPFVSFREGSGFDAITKYDKINQAVIAGMGGMEIINILSNKPKKLYDFIFQPMKDVIKLREFLINNHYKILVDKLVKDGNKYYNVLKVTKGKTRLTELELIFGTTNFTENYEVFFEYLNVQKEKLLNLKQQVGELSEAKSIELQYVEDALSLFVPENSQAQQEAKQTEENIEIKDDSLYNGGESDIVNQKLENMDNNSTADVKKNEK